MRRIIHNTTAIVACLSLMAPHVAMAQTHIPENAPEKHTSEKAGLVLAQAEEQPLPPDAAEQTDEAAGAETPAPAEADAPAGEAGTAAPVEAETEAPAGTEAERDAAVEAETTEPAATEAPAPVEAETETPAEAETVAPTETEAEAPTETVTPDEAPTEAEAPEAAAPAETEAPAEAEAETPAPAEAETEAPAEAEAETPAPAEAETGAPAEAEAEAPAPAEAETEAPAEAEAETTEPAAPIKKPAATETQPEQTDGQDVGEASDDAAPEDEDALAEALAKEEKASEEGAEQNDPAAPEDSEAMGEDELENALAEQEKAAEDAGQQPADTTEGEEKAEDAATEESTTEDRDESAAEESSETEPAGEAATETDVSDLSALTAEDGEGEVTEETVTEENSRSSSEDFTTNLNDALSGLAGQETQKSDDDDDNDALAKAALLGLGGLAIGAMLSNNREVELSTPDRLVVTHPDGSREVIKDETALLRQPGSTVTTENFEDGSSRTTVTRADGSKVVTIRDRDLRVLRRSLVSADGNSMPLIDDTAAAIPVDIASLPAPAEPVQTTDGSLNEEELRAALLRDIDVGRQFTLGQIRNISEVRALVAPINIDAITFDTGSAAIKADQAQQLSTLGKVIQQAIQENPQEIFLIEGHTDTVGDAAMNLALSDRRAESVALALAEYFDVPPENLVTQGYGEQFPKIATEGDNRENRRASVRRITELLQTASAE